MSNPKFKQGFLRNVSVSPRVARWVINLWPPFIGAGIHIEYIAADWSEARVRMHHRLLNSNIFGTHFGGSLFAMTDPFFAILMLHRLGRDYVLWDKASSIDFRLPARGTVRAVFTLSEADVEKARQMTASGEKYEPTFIVDIKNREGEIVARVNKTLYIRRKRAA